jgi:predicted HTH transcriptional regulator
MKRREVIAFIEEGENLHCEFKLKFSTAEKIAREICAFANTKGGFIFFGVEDDKTITGVDSEKAETELILDAASNYCQPPVPIEIQYMEFYGKEVVIVEIKESDNKPHRLQDYQEELDISNAVVCVRVNDKSIQASKEMIRVLKATADSSKLVKYVIGNNERAVFEYLSKNETITVKELSHLANISERRASRTLVKMVRANLLFIHTKDNGEDFFTSAG